MKLPVGFLGWTAEEIAAFHRTGKRPERTVEATSDPIRDRYRLEGELKGRREGCEEGFSEGLEEGLSEATRTHARQDNERSMKVRRKKMELWQRRAKQIMVDILNENSDLSSEKVAEAIRTRWTFKEPCPGHRTLADFVRKNRPAK
jgi:hypothetical protein